MKHLDSILPISDEGLYPIRTVSEVTGVNSITLRAWERRHNLFEPKRSPKGHRLYSDKDIERIHQVLALQAKGVSISRVSKVLTDNNVEVNSSHLSSIQNDSNKSKNLSEEEWKENQTELLLKISTYSVIELEDFHHSFISNYPIETVSKNLIIPILETLQNRAQELESQSGAYYFYKYFILNRLGGLFLKLAVQNSGKRIILMGLTENHCDVELLLFAMPFIQHGYELIIMGCNISLDAIPVSLAESKADGLLLCTDTNASNLLSSKAFEAIANTLTTPVFIAGSYTSDEQKSLKRSGLIVLPPKRKNQLETIDKKLNKSTK